MNQQRDLVGAVVAVVGASGGLGRAVCGQLSERGARLLLCGPHPDRLTALGLTLDLDPEDLVTVELDVRDAAAGDRLAAAATDRFGRLDGLINAAGIVAFGNLADTEDIVIEELFLTNVIGPLWLTRRVIPLLQASQGFVLNVSAVVAEQPLPGMAAYAATKAALTAADQAIGRELRRLGITVCDVRPPHTETGLATRPLAGVAPRLPEGLTPEAVAARIVSAIERGESAVEAAMFP